MHRSGTSALTRAIGYLDFALPTTLVPANPGNELGHWESAPICDFNDRLLAGMGQHWISWQPLDENWWHKADIRNLIAEAHDLIAREFGTTGDFVLKDPRLCRLLPFWMEVLAQLDVEPMVVLAYRHPREVGLSLERRNAILPEYGLLAWLRFMLDAERASRGVMRMTADFGQLIDNGGTVLAAVAAWAERKAGGAEGDARIAAFLDADLRHFAAEPDPRPLPAWVEAVNAIFARWSREGESAADLSKLDAIAGLLDQASPLFARLVEPTDHVRQLEAELYAAHCALAASDERPGRMLAAGELARLAGEVEAAAATLRDAATIAARAG